MKLSIYILIGLLLVISSERVKAQDCHNNEEFAKQVGNQIQTEFSMLDSLYLTFFVQYKIDSRGKINSVWINSKDVINTDFDNYISSAKGEPLKLLYRFYKNENEIRKMIYKIYDNSSMEICDKKGYYIQPIIVNLKSSNQFSNYENQQKALSELAKLNIEKYKFLPLLIIQRQCKNCL